jgi:kinetochor protein Mis14/NSL1
MDAHHRKIDLQSPADLTYLLNNIKAAAQQKLDLAIPPSAAPEGEDAYRSKVEELVQEVKHCSCLVNMTGH